VTFQRGVHAAVQTAELAGIVAEKMGTELANAGANAVRVGRQVERSERTHFPVSGDAGVGFDAHDGAVKDSDGLAAGPLVRRLM
jgi:hypothetical protein